MLHSVRLSRAGLAAVDPGETQVAHAQVDASTAAATAATPLSRSRYTCRVVYLEPTAEWSQTLVDACQQPSLDGVTVRHQTTSW